MPGTSYSDAVAYLFGLQRHGIKLGLEPTRTLLDALGSPHRRYRVLHVGGTNGKGSTAALASSILQAAGLRVGLYTSPHLVDFRERIRINGEMIAEDDVSELTTRIRRDCPSNLSPTFFEFTTALALKHFASAGVEVAVLEVGLGGRYDATNVVTPVVSCITTVALDHQEYLGHDLGSIAYEKAGIIKPRVPVVVGALNPEARRVVAETARAREAPMLALGVDFQVEGPTPATCTYRTRHRIIPALSCPLPGRHQLDNLACAVAAVEVGSADAFTIGDAAIRRGIADVRWPGRLEVIGERPRLVLDGAHNPAAAAVVSDYLSDFRRQCPGAKVWLVVGMMQEKDHAGFVRRLLPEVDEVIFTVPTVARSATGEQLSACMPSHGPPARIIPNARDAVRAAQRLAGTDDLICVTGSLMLIGEVKAYLQGLSLSPLRG